MISLEQYFLLGKQALLKSDHTEEMHAICSKIMKEHGGLCQCFQKSYGKHLQPYEIMGYAWEALPTAIEEWDANKGKATTAWGLIIRRITVAAKNGSIYVGGVRVTRKVVDRYSSQSYSEMVLHNLDADYLFGNEDYDIYDGADRSRKSVEE